MRNNQAPSADATCPGCGFKVPLTRKSCAHCGWPLLAPPSADATAGEHLQSCEFSGFNYADIQAAYVAGARSGREHQPTDALIERSADAYVKSVAPKRADATAGEPEFSVEAYPHVCRGGQHVGVSSGIRMTHLATGISVVSTQWRSQFRNRQAAEKRLREILAASAPCAECARLREALEALLYHYVALVESGDAGFWNPNDEAVVQRARAALRAPSTQREEEK